MKYDIEITINEKDSINIGLIVVNAIREKFACSGYNSAEYVDVTSIKGTKDEFTIILECKGKDESYYDTFESFVCRFIDNYEIIMISEPKE